MESNRRSSRSGRKEAHFDEAEKLLSGNLKSAEKFPGKDPRLPRTLFDLAEVYRAEGKYAEALPAYERALQIYTNSMAQKLQRSPTRLTARLNSTKA